MSYPVLSSFMTNHPVCNENIIMGATSEAGRALERPRFLVEFVLLDPSSFVKYFADHCLSFCPFSFGHYIVCPSSIYRI